MEPGAGCVRVRLETENSELRTAVIWTVLELVRWTAAYLDEKKLPEARLTAELLLAGALGLKRLDLYLQYDRPLSVEELARFKERLQRRVRREPLQYIEGEAAFRELTLTVDRRVLIPRPETEMLVGEVLRWSAGRAVGSLLDVGTGSGAIALSLAMEGEFRRIVGTDASDDALAVAKQNASRVGLAGRVDFRGGSLYAPVAGERFDVIVSNPPYIGTNEAADLPAEVRDWEPRDALFAGEAGLDVIAVLIADAPEHLKPGGLFALEIGERQGDAVAAMIRSRGCFGEPVTAKDSTGRVRFVLVEHLDGRESSS